MRNRPFSNRLLFLFLLFLIRFSAYAFPAYNVSVLDPGAISAPSSTPILYGSDPGSILQTPASGGSGNYTYQWESSPDNISWTLIPNSNQADFDPGPLYSSVYLKRQVSDGSNSAETGSTLIGVYQQLDPGTLRNTNSTILNYGQDPGYITETGGVAAACPNSRVYEWQYSIDSGLTWNSISGTNNENYDPGGLLQTTTFRRKVSCSGQEAFTNSITISVYPRLDPGQISYNHTITPGTDPGPITETPASGGAGGPFNYVWQGSSDGSTWSYLVHTESFDPGVLNQTMYFRRYVDDGKVSTFSNTVPVIVGYTALPVTFLSFSVFRKDSNINLYWSTSQEKESKNFSVEKSADGTTWSAIGTINATGNTTLQNNYYFSDHHPYNGMNYYRIVETDVSNAAIYSTIEKIEYTTASFSVHLYGNPVHDEIHLRVEQNESRYLQFCIYDATGRLRVNSNQLLSKGVSHVQIPTYLLASGVYILKIRRENDVQAIRVTKN